MRMRAGAAVIIVVNKWDLMTTGKDGMRLFDGKPPADQKVYEQQVRDKSEVPGAMLHCCLSRLRTGKNIEQVFKKVELGGARAAEARDDGADESVSGEGGLPEGVSADEQARAGSTT